ncbi:MAG: hypothetical protein BGO84_04285 [Dysgonomonas sp. 37-18]|uniref:M56 family metallopeptidase n=2 Tax=Dysgonomonadaceae TaxID=2005520 RepID=UPI0009283481|nr:M56 family metallopeptidase [uncultured Dysgonomonas sp.]MBN9301479.1 M56 family metallopeptidase [Dysgonomonas mossii]OJX62721.1 MAG: hypothetical protein BGO84_04285 [Dysgonomonas sp. 37-18]
MEHTIIPYLIKASISLALFYGLYMLLLRKDTFFRLRRFYFLFSIAFSLLFPFLMIEMTAKEEVPVQIPAYWLSQIEVSAMPAQQVLVIDWKLIALFAIGAVSLIYALRFIMQLFCILKLKVSHNSEKLDTCCIVKIKDRKISPFSFFRWIFIGSQIDDEEKLKEIIAHEMVHVRQLHSVDVLLAEIVCILFWWNPFVWLLKKEIKINLEYLADEGVLKEGFSPKEYQYILLQVSNVNTGIPIINNFNVSQLKKRITMMNKNRTSLGKATKYLLLVPVVFVLLLGNAVQASPDIADMITIPFVNDGQQVPQKKGDVYVTVDKMPEFPGGLNAQQRFIGQNLKYPVEAQEKGVEGRVIVRYVIRSTGDITNIEVIRGVYPSLDEEVVRIVKAMPKWIPGKQNGKAVDVYYTLPLIFKISGSKKIFSEGKKDKDVMVAVGYGTPKKEGVTLKEGGAEPSVDHPFITVEDMPVFPGGESAMQRFVADNLKYPESAQKAGVQGRVTVRFIVGKTGEISDVRVIRGIDSECDAEAVRMIQSMPKWTPGKQNGIAVPVYFTLPIVYRLKKDTVVNTTKK